MQNTKTILPKLWAVGDSLEKPWGGFKIIDIGPGYLVKRLTINPGQRCSLQRHLFREERWTVVLGTAKIHIDGTEYDVNVGDAIHIPLRAMHRAQCTSDVPFIIIETWKGIKLLETDIERFSDDYGRVDQPENEKSKNRENETKI